MEVRFLHYKMMTAVDRGRLCIYNVISKQPLKKLYKDIYIYTQKHYIQIKVEFQNNVQVTYKKSGKTKQRNKTKQKIKNKMADS